MGHPQFNTQDDNGIGDGIPPIPEWQLDPASGPVYHDPELSGPDADVDYEVRNVFTRLRNAFHRAQQTSFPTTRLHDLTCFVVHRLLLSAPDTMSPRPPPPLTECIRYAIILYMLIVQGPTYFSHAVLLNATVARLVEQLERLEWTIRECGSLDVWLLATGMVASAGSMQYQWFFERGRALAASLQLENWDDILVRIKSVLWLETLHGEDVFRPHWDAVLNPATDHPGPPGLPLSVSPPVWFRADQNQSVLLTNIRL